MCAPTPRGPSSALLRPARTVGLELRRARGREQARRDVDLDVELAELGLEVRVGDRLEHLGVAHRGVARIVDQVELDLAADRRPLGVEARLAQHAREHVQAAATFWR